MNGDAEERSAKRVKVEDDGAPSATTSSTTAKGEQAGHPVKKEDEEAADRKVKQEQEQAVNNGDSVKKEENGEEDDYSIYEEYAQQEAVPPSGDLYLDTVSYPNMPVTPAKTMLCVVSHGLTSSDSSTLLPRSLSLSLPFFLFLNIAAFFLLLPQINRAVLDFDFERLCSVSLSNINVYACLVCGKYFQGRGKSSHAYAHSIHEDHHVFMNLQTLKVGRGADARTVKDPGVRLETLLTEPLLASVTGLRAPRLLRGQ